MKNLFGLAQLVLLVGWFPTCGLVGYFLSRRIRRDKPDPVAPTPVHVHIVDLERSEITISDIGGIYGRCIVAGCGEAFYIAPSLARVNVGKVSV
jgi:hypothetical protein